MARHLYLSVLYPFYMVPVYTLVYTSMSSESSVRMSALCCHSLYLSDFPADGNVQAGVQQTPNKVHCSALSLKKCGRACPLNQKKSGKYVLHEAHVEEKVRVPRVPLQPQRRHHRLDAQPKHRCNQQSCEGFRASHCLPVTRREAQHQSEIGTRGVGVEEQQARERDDGKINPGGSKPGPQWQHVDQQMSLEGAEKQKAKSSENQLKGVPEDP
mmetsp:Transcript_55175/g.107928  ORF Transcript_55175/g.107928 Transcript_55175/m.107928 type:complete len:213 (-) Transcript_55175:467-1105(-)